MWGPESSPCITKKKKKSKTQLFVVRNTLTIKDTHTLKVKGLKIIYQASGNWKQAVLTHNWQSRLQVKINQNLKSHCVLIKGTIHKEVKTIENL
jgi:hypothetical protein